MSPGDCHCRGDMCPCHTSSGEKKGNKTMQIKNEILGTNYIICTKLITNYSVHTIVLMDRSFIRSHGYYM